MLFTRWFVGNIFSHHADEIDIEVFPHVLAAFLIGSSTLLTAMWVVVIGL